MSELSFEQLCLLFNYTPKNHPLSSSEVAEIFKVSDRTVEGWRLTGEGPRYFSPKGTRRVWYAERDVLAWMGSGARHSTSENVAA